MPETALPTDIVQRLETAFEKRNSLLNDPENDALRVFNGFYEGCSAFSLDLYGDTAVILWMNKSLRPAAADLEVLRDCCLEKLPGVRTVLLKDRFSPNAEIRKGQLLSGEAPAAGIHEWGIPYDIDLRLNKDCGFYLDSALLRRWLLNHAAGKRVLNTFAYTGSLGDAAEAGGALAVTQTDLNRNYLREKHPRQEYISGDFFDVTSRLRRSERLFDIIILDPPLYARAGRGAKVDMLKHTAALVNKVRPLAAHEGKLIVINNALFLSGQDFLSEMEALCGPYLAVSELIPVPPAFYGFDPIPAEKLPADPSPFNHTTKILVLATFRKDGRK